MAQKKKLSKAKIRTIVVAAISAVIVLALLITNAFVPVKYLASYTVLRNKGANAGVMRVRYVDAGFGDCTIIELPDGKNMLIDGGNGQAANMKRILKFLNKCDIDTIDYLVCTSVKAEHCGGLTEILHYKNVKKIFMPFCKNTYVTNEFRNFSFAVTKSNIERVVSQYGVGEVNSESGYFFTFLSPSPVSNPDSEYNGLGSNSSDDAINNASAVMWLEYAGTSFLFASDVTDKVLNGVCETYILEGANYAHNGGKVVNLENCKVFQAANHGEKSSSCTRLYDLAKPETVVISVGKNGRGCPSAETLFNAANYAGDKIYRTDEYGTVTIEVTGDGYSIV